MEGESHQLKKQDLRKQGLIEIPMNVDTSRYFIGNVRWFDIIWSLPFISISIIIMIILHNMNYLNTSTFVFSLLPPVLALTFLYIKHPYRKNISFIKTVWWRMKFKMSKKTYEFTKERTHDMKEDIRSQIGIFNIANDTYETIDNRVVKVIEVSSVNLTGMSENDREKTLRAYQSFLNNLPQHYFPFQVEQFAKPINLKNYMYWTQQKMEDEKSFKKRTLFQSYIDKTNEIQKSKKMVNKSRFVILSENIGTNKEKALQKLSNKTESMVSSIENMLDGKYSLSASVLNNEELFYLIYSSIDYENAQVKQNVNVNNILNLPITLGQKSYENMKKEWEEEERSRIM